MAVLAALAMVFSSVVLAGPARGDGDPASDVLASQVLFLAQDAGLSPAQQSRLGALVEAARRSGYPVRVAVVASPSDLGSVTALWRQPESYARFLGQELSLSYRGPLLVVMPNGYGRYQAGRPADATPGVLARLPAPGRQLGAGAIDAVRRLAAAAGHALPLPAAAEPTSAGSTDPMPWLVLAVGMILIGLAWTASLRARPLHSAKRASSS